MLNRILINILSAVIYLVCSAFFLMIFNCDIFFFLTWSLPLTVGIAISGQRLIYFCKNSKGGNRLLIILIIASVISIIWLYAFFSLWDSQQDMFKMPLIFLFIVCSFIQLVFIDRVQKKLSEEITFKQNMLRILMNPILIISVFFILFFQNKRYEKRQSEIAYQKSIQPLQNYFSTFQIKQIQDHIKNFDYIVTAHDLHVVYSNIDLIYSSLADSLTVQQGRHPDSIQDYEPINKIVSGIHFEHYEGDAVLINPDLVAFKSMAKTTAEKCDDTFIEIMQLTYGDEKFFAKPKWLNQVNDYASSSLLGDGIELEILGKIQKALLADKEFGKELNDLRDIILYDILQARCYEYDSPKIVTEINKIMESITFSEEEKIKINARIKEFQNHSNDIQLGCAEKQCKCGG